MTRMHEDDQAAVAQVLAGDKNAYGGLVERHSKVVFRLAFRMTGNEQDAEEVVQETFLRGYRHLHKFESRANFGTWIYRIAVNCALDLVGKRKNVYSYQIADEPDLESNEVQIASSSPGPERLAFSGQMAGRIEQAMSGLSANERAAFIMRHMEGQSMEAIGKVLGLRPDSAKQSVFRAVHKLRRALEPALRTR